MSAARFDDMIFIAAATLEDKESIAKKNASKDAALRRSVSTSTAMRRDSRPMARSKFTSLVRTLSANDSPDEVQVNVGKDMFLDDSAAFIHRKFGESRQFSQGDKSYLISALSERLNSMHDKWSKYRSKNEKSLELEHEKATQIDQLISRAVAELLDFLKTHEVQLTTNALGSVTTTEHLARSACLAANNTQRLEAYRQICSLLFCRVDTISSTSTVLEEELSRCRLMLRHQGKSQPLDTADGNDFLYKRIQTLSASNASFVDTNLRERKLQELITRTNFQKKRNADIRKEIEKYRMEVTRLDAEMNHLKLQQSLNKLSNTYNIDTT